jgi:hypothetical protein
VLVGDTARVPLVAFLPVQLPEAVHEVALVEDQVTIEILPEVMLVGLAENVTVGEWIPRNVESIWLRVSNVNGVVSAATAGSDTASKAGEASTKGETAIVEASALSGALALRREKTKMERTCITPNRICRNPQTITAIMVKICRGSCYSQLIA